MAKLFEGSTLTRKSIIQRTLSGIVSFAGVVVGSLLIPVIKDGILSFVGTSVRKSVLTRIIDGVVSFVGTSARSSVLKRTQAGIISFVGSVTSGEQLSETVEGVLSFIGRGRRAVYFLIGEFTRQVNYKRLYSSGLSFSADVFKALLNIRSGVLSFAGTLSKVYSCWRTQASSFGTSGTASRYSVLWRSQYSGSLPYVAFNGSIEYRVGGVTEYARTISGGLSFLGVPSNDVMGEILYYGVANP